MLRVRVGIHNRLGYVHISYREYEFEMAKGGNKYVTVHTDEGKVDFRCKYLREVEEVETCDTNV